MKKKNVGVEVTWTKEGAIIPTAIIWDTGNGPVRFKSLALFLSVCLFMMTMQKEKKNQMHGRREPAAAGKGGIRCW